MRVVQIVASVKDESSGPSYSVPGLCAGLQRTGCEVELHCFGPIPERLSQRCFEIVSYPRYDIFNLGNSRLMKRGLASSAADIIHNNGLWMFPNVYCATAAKSIGAKLVMAPRGCLAIEALHRGRLKKQLFGSIWQYPALKMADLFHATSEKEYFEIRSAGYRQPVAIVPIGLDVPPRKLGVHRARKTIAFFGRLHPGKGADRLLEAWKRIFKEYPDWEVMIAGPDCGMLSTLHRIVREYQLPRVGFLGELHGGAKYEFLSSADLYVLPTETENFGITVAEALACGVPVITTKGAPWSGVEMEHCGWWIENTIDGLTKALKSAMSMPASLLTVMGDRGRKWIERDFSWTGVGRQMKSAYKWLLCPQSVERPDFVRID